MLSNYARTASATVSALATWIASFDQGDTSGEWIADFRQRFDDNVIVSLDDGRMVRFAYKESSGFGLIETNTDVPISVEGQYFDQSSIILAGPSRVRAITSDLEVATTDGERVMYLDELVHELLDSVDLMITMDEAMALVQSNNLDFQKLTSSLGAAVAQRGPSAKEVYSELTAYGSALNDAAVVETFKGALTGFTSNVSSTSTAPESENRFNRNSEVYYVKGFDVFAIAGQLIVSAAEMASTILILAGDGIMKLVGIGISILSLIGKAVTAIDATATEATVNLTDPYVLYAQPLARFKVAKEVVAECLAHLDVQALTYPDVLTVHSPYLTSYIMQDGAGSAVCYVEIYARAAISGRTNNTPSPFVSPGVSNPANPDFPGECNYYETVGGQADRVIPDIMNVFEDYSSDIEVPTDTLNVRATLSYYNYDDALNLPGNYSISEDKLHNDNGGALLSDTLARKRMTEVIGGISHRLAAACSYAYGQQFGVPNTNYALDAFSDCWTSSSRVTALSASENVSKLAQAINEWNDGQYTVPYRALALLMWHSQNAYRYLTDFNYPYSWASIVNDIFPFFADLIEAHVTVDSNRPEDYSTLFFKALVFGIASFSAVPSDEEVRPTHNASSNSIPFNGKPAISVWRNTTGSPSSFIITPPSYTTGSISAVILTSVAIAAAATFAAFKAYRALKARVARRTVKLNDELASARKAYLADPSQENALAFDSAYRRANMWGIVTTGSSINPYTSASVGLQQTGSLFNPRSTEQTILNDDDNTERILKVISG